MEMVVLMQAVALMETAVLMEAAVLSGACYWHCGHFHLPIRCALPGVICTRRRRSQRQ